jgi:hypothetical protein
MNVLINPSTAEHIAVLELFDTLTLLKKGTITPEVT